MASNTRASPASPRGNRRSMVRSVASAAWASAGSNWRNDDSGMATGLAEIGRLRAHGTVGREDDLLDLHLGLGQLLLAVPLQQRAAFVGRNRLVELHLAALELLDDALQLLQRVLEGEARDVLGQGVFLGHFLRLSVR